MITSIIFDCFGVLTEDGWLAFKNKWVKPHQLMQAQDLNKQHDRGLLSYDDFLVQLSELTQATQQEADELIRRNHHPNVQLFQVIEQLKDGYKIGMLSNIASDYLSEVFSYDQINLFNALSLSGESGYIKPEPGAYQDILQKLEVDATETIFIDDREGFVKGAEDIGMKALLYENVDKLKNDLRSMGISL